MRDSFATSVLCAALAILLGASGCGLNILPDPEVMAAALPSEADVAVGATHDLLLAACQDHLTLMGLVAPVAVTAVFVGLGRLDAVFYLPGALVEAAVPSCKAKSF